MKIAVISDTHDNLKKVEQFVNEIRDETPDYIIHLGDIVSPFVIPYLSELSIPGIIVKGNNDGDTDFLGELCYKAGFKFVIPPYKFTLDSKNFLITHRPLEKGKYKLDGIDYYLYGHTHYAKIEKTGKTLTVNPGTISGYVSGKSTFVFLDTALDKVELRNL